MQSTEIEKQIKQFDNDIIAEFCCKYDINFWSQYKRGFYNPPHIIEWNGYINSVIHRYIKRLCIIGPRDSAKSEVFAVNLICYLARYGMELGWDWLYLFSDTQEQANEIIDRGKTAIEITYPDLLINMMKDDVKEKRLASGFRFTGRGAGASVRGAHPAIILGDDILNDKNSDTNKWREKIKRWWFQTVTNMARPDSAIILEGTVQHELDLLMTMKDNPSYTTRVYPSIMEVSDEEIANYNRSHPQNKGVIPSWTVFPENVIPRILKTGPKEEQT